MTSNRFHVAFSFAGEKRDFVARVAAILAASFTEAAILYDKYHRAEFSRSDLGIYLPDLYHNHSDLIVAVICSDYEKKEWAGLEWSAIHALIQQRKQSEVMLCRFDHATVKGLSAGAGFVELDKKTPEGAAIILSEKVGRQELIAYACRCLAQDHSRSSPGSAGPTGRRAALRPARGGNLHCTTLA